MATWTWPTKPRPSVPWPFQSYKRNESCNFRWATTRVYLYLCIWICVCLCEFYTQIKNFYCLLSVHFYYNYVPRPLLLPPTIYHSHNAHFAHKTKVHLSALLFFVYFGHCLWDSFPPEACFFFGRNLKQYLRIATAITKKKK